MEEPTLEQLIDEVVVEAVEEVKTEAATPKIEEEQAFIIDSDNPKEVLQRLCEFEKLNKMYLLDTGELLHIVDTFYDTPEGLIKGGGNSIRVREVNGEPFVTIKGKNKSKTGNSERSELEVKWGWDAPSPHNIAELFGMEVTQVRETDRIARNIYRKYDEKIIAELAIDKVKYGFASVYEIEIEMKSQSGMPLWSLTKDLEKKFPELKRWTSSKFAMGNVLEYALAIKVDENGFLTPESFAALSKLKVVDK